MRVTLHALLFRHLQHRVLVAAFDDGESCVVFVGRDTLMIFGHHLQLHVTNAYGRMRRTSKTE